MSSDEKTMNQRTPAIAASGEADSLTALMDHIVETHHAFCRRELPRLETLLKTAVDMHGRRYPEIRRIHALFSRMSKDLAMHLLKEEETLFPYIAQVEDCVRRNIPASWPRFGTMESPVRLLVEDHDQTENELRAIRHLSNNFTPPSGTAEDVADFSELFEALSAFERNMQQHIHAENDLLFPRAVALEAEACARK